MALTPYAKPHATPQQWITHLRNRGLVIPRPSIAAKKIELIGYERLRIYFLSRRQTGLPNKPFRANTSYQDILRIYRCDEQLRAVCFEACGLFELAFRNTMSEVLSDAYGSHPYDNINAFVDAATRRKAVLSLSSVYEKSKDARAKHYLDKYSSPLLPPVWVLKELLTFGASTHLYNALSGSLQSEIARRFGVPSRKVFATWLLCLVDLRNICAHHDRLFNRSFQKQPPALRSANLPTAPPNKLKAVLECMDYMLSKRGLPIGTVAKAKKVLDRYPEVQPAEAGW